MKGKNGHLIPTLVSSIWFDKLNIYECLLRNQMCFISVNF